MIGQLLDRRYKIVQSLSVGGFGHTYIAEDLRIPGHPKCVVKHLKPASNNPKLLATAERLFWSEAESLAQLGTHDQIPRILAFFEENQEFFLVQELVEGHLLTEELIPEKKLSESYVIDLLKDVLPILEFIHQQEVIHRDIKPANLIRRQQDNKLVLIDFGAVKQVRTVANSIQDRRATVSIGTPGYMSTEQGRGKPRANSDIYGLGIIAIQALTGLEPGDLDEDSQSGEILWQDHVSISPGLAEILKKMVRYHFKDRYQSATEVLQDLQQLENPSGTSTVRDTVVAANTPVHELTLGWSEAGRRRTQSIRNQQASKNPGTVRIGSDPAQCDIVLSEPTVSGLHAEFFFNSQQERFYLRNLHQSNPVIVDGQYLPVGEVALNQGSNIRLGQLVLRVTAITQNQYLAKNKPTEYVTQLQPAPPHTIHPTVEPSNALDVEPSPTPINRPIPIVPSSSPRRASFLSGKLFLIGGLGVVMGAIAGVAFIILPQSNTHNTNNPNISFEEQLNSQLCRVVSPTKGELNAKVRDQPLKEAMVTLNVDKGTKVLYVGQQDAFVEIQFADGSKGWVYNDQIQPCQ
ncbi:MAG TPA: serine/threonine protein kinase [Cyanobacteria bacterium UBA8553]|nr:serine/threonine protein kinase [Cyanobacteria bacterium UBA8553]HAJ64737.1 serine/threonine protein kinase [Cyanobacteria bacterium UBA8543]